MNGVFRLEPDGKMVAVVALLVALLAATQPGIAARFDMSLASHTGAMTGFYQKWNVSSHASNSTDSSPPASLDEQISRFDMSMASNTRSIIPGAGSPGYSNGSPMTSATNPTYPWTSTTVWFSGQGMKGQFSGSVTKAFYAKTGAVKYTGTLSYPKAGLDMQLDSCPAFSAAIFGRVSLECTGQSLSLSLANKSANVTASSYIESGMKVKQLFVTTLSFH